MEQAVETRWLSYVQAVAYTGLGRTTLTALVTSGEVAAAKIGKRVLLDRASLDDFLESHTYAGDAGE